MLYRIRTSLIFCNIAPKIQKTNRKYKKNSVKNNISPITHHPTSITQHLLPITCYLSPITYYLLPITCYLSPVTYLLPIT